MRPFDVLDEELQVQPGLSNHDEQSRMTKAALVMSMFCHTTQIAFRLVLHHHTKWLILYKTVGSD